MYSNVVMMVSVETPFEVVMLSYASPFAGGLFFIFFSHDLLIEIFLHHKIISFSQRSQSSIICDSALQKKMNGKLTFLPNSIET